MTRYPRQVDREYLSCRSGGLNKIQMIDGGTLDLHQDLVACNGRRRYIVEHQLPTVFQQSDSFHAHFPLGRFLKGSVVKPLHNPSLFEEEHACGIPGSNIEAHE